MSVSFSLVEVFSEDRPQRNNRCHSLCSLLIGKTNISYKTFEASAVMKRLVCGTLVRYGPCSFVRVRACVMQLRPVG